MTEIASRILADARRLGVTSDTLLTQASRWAAEAKAAMPGWPRQFARRFERANREAAAALAEQP